VVLLVMSHRGMDKHETDKLKIGADASAAAGPVGRTATAATDVQLHAEIPSYSRTRGVFAGLALDGTVVSEDASEDILDPVPDRFSRLLVQASAAG